MNTAAEFVRELEVEFPELREDLRNEAGLLHNQMHAFTRMTQAAIDARDLATVRRQLMFADRFFRHAEPDLENAFYVSFLEDLDFSGRHGERAQELLSSALRQGRVRILDYLQKLRGTRDV